jgi:hypothetical protein
MKLSPLKKRQCGNCYNWRFVVKADDRPAMGVCGREFDLTGEYTNLFSEEDSCNGYAAFPTVLDPEFDALDVGRLLKDLNININ